MKPKTLDARGLAAEWLDQVLAKRRPLDEVTEALPNDAAMSARDRAFAVLLCLTVLRRLGQIDDMIGRCLERPLPNRARGADLALRLGAAQLLFLETPPHAAVDTSVTLAVARGAGAYRKLVNAVLRRLGREGADWRDAQDAARLNTPDWLWQSWSEAYGETTARAIAEAHLHEPPLDLTAKGDPATIAESLSATRLATGSLRRNAGGRVNELPGFEAGDCSASVQATR
jgi:16S rRNA (cytosine967-C5)-methyltransferase